MAEYIYGWDAVNRKKRYMGKYASVNQRNSGYFKRNSSGDKQTFVDKDAGIKREFVGSNTKEYPFYNEKHGTHTITAESFSEALRIAKSLGYTRADYRKRKRGR